MADDTRVHKVPDISCGHCKQAIETEVVAPERVDSAVVDVDQRRQCGRQRQRRGRRGRDPGGRLRDPPRVGPRSSATDGGLQAPIWISSICHLP